MKQAVGKGDEPLNLSLIVDATQELVDPAGQAVPGDFSIHGRFAPASPPPPALLPNESTTTESFTIDGSTTTDRTTEGILDELLKGVPPTGTADIPSVGGVDLHGGIDLQGRLSLSGPEQNLSEEDKDEESKPFVTSVVPEVEAEPASPTQIPARAQVSPDGQEGRIVLKSTSEDEELAELEQASEEEPTDSVQPLAGRNAKAARKGPKQHSPETWKRVKAIPNTTRLMVGDDDELDLSGMQVNVQIDGFRARVLIDCFYYNDREQPLEGDFKLRLPDDASLYYFAFGESKYEYAPDDKWIVNEFQKNGTTPVSLEPDRIRQQRQDDWKNCKEARMAERAKAAFAYNRTMRRKIDPALVEWSGAGVFNAKVFPLNPKKMHRIVMGYDVNLLRTPSGWNYELDLPERPGQCQVDVRVSKSEQTDVTVESHVRDNGSDQAEGLSHYEHFRWTNPKPGAVKINLQRAGETLLTSAADQQEPFWGIQFAPELPVEQVKSNQRAIFMLDTSLSSSPDKFNVWLKLMEATLNQNRDSLKQFNVLFFDVGSSFWKTGYVDNTPENVAALLETCNELSLEGATDLYGAVEKITQADWVCSENKPGPDLFLLSDGAANWGETNVRLIQQQLTQHSVGSLFAYQTGLTGTAIRNLRFLANRSGGAVFSVATESEIETAATAHRNRPWKIDSIDVAGATDVMTAGRVEWVYPGQTLIMVGRGKPEKEIQLELTQLRKKKIVSLNPELVKSELAARLYGQVAVGQLESLGGRVSEVATSYARHFRITGRTCSLVMLETEAEYEQFGIKPQEDLFVIQSKQASELIADTLEQFSSQLADPKAQMMAWLKRMETMPGMEFRIPTALQLALDKIKFESISVPLQTDPQTKHSSAKEYLAALTQQKLDYDLVAAESRRRSATSIDDAVKVFSSLIERNPGDLIIARDVAFTAMELDRPAQAYPLLLKVAYARPYEASVYPAIGQCLARLEKADMAIPFYELALNAKFQNRDKDYHRIVAAEYLHLLSQITRGKLKTSIPEFVAARKQTLHQTLGFETADLVVTMQWNTDQTDVDLHIVEPTGEECSYQNKKTRIGGQITRDITTGFGPEMYVLKEAPTGKYDVLVKLFANNQSRTSLRNKVHLTFYQNYGTENELIRRETVLLKTVGEKEQVGTVGVE